MLFIKISVVLFTKLQSTLNYEQAQRYQKWAKSTLVLVPLFGIHYSVLVVMYFFVELNEVAEVVYLMGDQLFASSQVFYEIRNAVCRISMCLQGFFVAILYCFLNSEVKTELKPYAHSFLTYLATNNFFKFFFPCRDRYLRYCLHSSLESSDVHCTFLAQPGEGRQYVRLCHAVPSTQTGYTIIATAAPGGTSIHGLNIPFPWV